MTTSWLRGDWMQTHTGRRFYPLDPRIGEIDSEDIAHALSLLCRYGGHSRRFYSVAEHSVLMSFAVKPEHALTALLHDATEAYVCDVPRPLKLVLDEYRRIEDSVWAVIAAKYHLPAVLPAEVKEADTRILIDERRALLPMSEHWPVEDTHEPLGVHIRGWMPEVAEELFTMRLEELLP